MKPVFFLMQICPHPPRKPGQSSSAPGCTPTLGAAHPNATLCSCLAATGWGPRDRVPHSAHLPQAHTGSWHPRRALGIPNQGL